MTIKSTYEELKKRIGDLKIPESDRNKILEGLRETEAEYTKINKQNETLLKNPAMAIFQTDIEGNILFLNDVFVKMFGYDSPEELVAENAAKLYKNPEARAHLLEEIKTVGKVENYEADFVKKNGKTITVLFNASLQDGILSGSLIDISKRKQIENELFESEAYNKILFRESWLANVVMDPETGKFIDCNPAAAKLYGYSDCSEVIGKTPVDVSAPVQYDGTDSAAATSENAKKALNTGHHIFLCKHRRPDGTIWDGEVALFAFTYKQKKMLQFIVQDITERKKAQDALRKSNFFLSRSQKVGKIGSFVLNIPKDDPDAQTWESTSEMDRIFGIDDAYPRTGESWLAIIVQRDEVAAYFKQQVFDTKKIFKKEYQILRPSDGEVRWISGRGELEFDDQGNCIRMIGTVQDITERRRAEELLRQSQTQLSEAMKMARAGHWEYDVAGDTFTFNDHFYRIFRTTVEDVGGYHMSSGEYIRRFCHPDDAHIVEKEVQMVIEASDPKYSPLIEYRILFADGGVGNVVVRFFIVKDDQGRTIRCFGVIQDITERKKAEESRRFTQFAIDSTIDQAFWTTADGYLVYVNDAACRTLGYSREELMALSVFDIVPTFSPQSFATHWRELQEKKNDTFETFHRAKDGRVYPVEVRSNYVVFDGIEYNCAFATDITERKRMESEREELINNLQKALAEIKELRGILPICSNCKKIRDDKGYWTQIESYIHEHSNAEFSHGICPDCTKKLYPDLYDELYPDPADNNESDKK